MEIIKVENVIKKFGNYAAVNNVSFDVEEGRIVGLLGPNGAGKTTMIRMITNIFMPDEGKITLFGEPNGQNHQNRIGYLPEERGLYKKNKVLEMLTYFGQLKGMSSANASQTAQSWLNKMDAGSWSGKKIQELSKGMQQKVQFIGTILHNPTLLILDEPFSGFDPINAELLKKIILDMKAEGKTIILSTHVMEQVEQLCDDIFLINKGKIILSGNVRQVKKGFGKDTVIMEYEGDDGFLNSFSNLRFINRSNNRAEFRIDINELATNELLQKAIDNVKIYRFEVVEPSLNEIFIEVVSKQGEDNE